LEQIHEISSACHKRFKTEAQAEAFIEDWEESFADVLRVEVKKALDRPRSRRFQQANNKQWSAIYFMGVSEQFFQRLEDCFVLAN
jgi:hypothetical protein